MTRDMPSWMSLLPPRWRNEIDKDTARAIAGEFVGTFLFVFLSTTGTRTALAVGVAYTITSYSVAALSGGHLNPLISIAFALSGHQHAAQSGLYIIAQILGSIAAALVEGLLLPGIHIGHNSHALPPGCLPHLLHSSGWFGTILWELILSSVFLLVVYGTFIGHPKFQPVGPLAAGLAIYAAIESGGTYSGAVINPARLIGSAVVFLCGWRRFWFYIIGELLAAFIVAGFATTYWGVGPAYAENRDELYDRAGGRLSEGLMPESDA